MRILIWTLLPAALLCQDSEKEIERQVKRFESDSTDERELAVKEIVKLGHKAIPSLERYLSATDPEVAARAKATIDKITKSDPLFLVRPPKRRVTVDIKNASFEKALEKTFSSFYPRPAPGLRTGDIKPFDLKLKDATYWEAVMALRKASGAFIERNFAQVWFVGYQEQAYAESPPQGLLWSTATAVQEKNTVRLQFQPMIEVGCRPAGAKFIVSRIEDESGADLTAKFSLVEQKRRGEFMTLPQWDWKANTSDISTSKLRLRGTLTLSLVSEVESAEVRADGFKEPVTLKVSECAIAVNVFTVGATSVNTSIAMKGPEKYEPPEGKQFRSYLCSILADDEGRALEASQFEYAGNGGMVSRGSLGYKPTRLVFIRPLEVESVSVDVDISGITIASK